VEKEGKYDGWKNLQESILPLVVENGVKGEHR